MVYEDLVITGSHIDDETGRKGPAGDVRAWDIRTGKLVWTFHTVPRPGEKGHETWGGDSWKDVAGANVWSFFTVDAQRGILYMPVGSANNDHYGADRSGSNLFGNSLVAVEARTGKLKWYFQAIHHDLGDSDMPAAPMLFDVVRHGKKIPAVAVITKNPLLFILNRETGKPSYGVEERPVPKSLMQGEQASPTQPFPTAPPAFAQQVRPDLRLHHDEEPRPDQAQGAPDDEGPVEREIEHSVDVGQALPRHLLTRDGRRRQKQAEPRVTRRQGGRAGGAAAGSVRSHRDGRRRDDERTGDQDSCEQLPCSHGVPSSPAHLMVSDGAGRLLGCSPEPSAPPPGPPRDRSPARRVQARSA